MATYQHFETAEHEERSVSCRISAGEKYTEATGSRETVKYTGPWADMLALMNSQSGGGSVEVSCDLERLGGGIGELRITRETYRIPADNEGEEEEPGGGESGGGELGSEAAPCYTCSSSCVQVCILAHPKFAGIGDLPRRALKAMLDGQDECSFLDVPGEGSSAQRMIKDCIGNDAAARLAFKLIGKGVTSYLDVQTEITARWRGRNNSYVVGEIVENPPGGFRGAAGRDFLVTGAGMERSGSETWCSASFRMSGAGGWDKEIYAG